MWFRCRRLFQEVTSGLNSEGGQLRDNRRRAKGAVKAAKRGSHPFQECELGIVRGWAAG